MEEASSLVEAAEEIRRRRALYRECKRYGLKNQARGEIEEALFWYTAAAFITRIWPFGHWYDDEIERGLAKIADSLSRRAGLNRKELEGAPPTRLVHLTSNVLDGGGHSEVMLLWSNLITKWGDVEQHFVSSEWVNSREAGANRLQQITETVSSFSLCPRELGPSARVLWLYERLSELRPHLLILHINPDDAISVCAALMLRENVGSRILFFNHADHLFNLGLRQADRVIEYRPTGVRLTIHGRHVEAGKVCLVPLGSSPKPSSNLSRAELGIPEESTVSVTVAAFYKLEPKEDWNYARAIRDLLSVEPNHYHLIVGDGAQTLKEEMLKEFASASQSVHERLRWMGKRLDIDAILKVSDFVIDSFPYIGGAVKVDAMRVGKPIVAFRNDKFGIITETGTIARDYPLVAKSNEEVVEYSRRLIADPSLRVQLGEKLLAQYQSTFSDAVISEALRRALFEPVLADSASTVEPVPPFDEVYFSKLGGRLTDLQNVVEHTELYLRHKHRPTRREHWENSFPTITQLGRRARESMKYRLRQLLSR